MQDEIGSLNASAAAVNLANILSSCRSNVRQSGLVLMINNAMDMFASCKDKYADKKGEKPVEIRLSLDGEVYIDGRKVDPKNPIPGYKIFIDRKNSRA